MAKIMDEIVTVLPVTIAKLKMKPGDTLVVRTDMGILAEAHVDDFVGQLRQLVPEGCNAAILPLEAQLTIIPKETI